MNLARTRRMGGALVCATVLILLSTLTASAGTPAPALEGVVNINQASPKELALLPGIGLKKAERIVAYRSRRPFKRSVELARVRGIGLKTVRALKPFLRVEGPTTLSRPSMKRTGGST